MKTKFSQVVLELLKGWNYSPKRNCILQKLNVDVLNLIIKEYKKVTILHYLGTNYNKAIPMIRLIDTVVPILLNDEYRQQLR
jgi:hypothetical protein